jgi:hypothetical protein
MAGRGKVAYITGNPLAPNFAQLSDCLYVIILIRAVFFLLICYVCHFHGNQKQTNPSQLQTEIENGSSKQVFHFYYSVGLY